MPRSFAARRLARHARSVVNHSHMENLESRLLMHGGVGATLLPDGTTVAGSMQAQEAGARHYAGDSLRVGATPAPTGVVGTASSGTEAGLSWSGAGPGYYGYRSRDAV